MLSQWDGETNELIDYNAQLIPSYTQPSFTSSQTSLETQGSLPSAALQDFEEPANTLLFGGQLDPNQYDMTSFIAGPLNGFSLEFDAGAQFAPAQQGPSSGPVALNPGYGNHFAGPSNASTYSHAGNGPGIVGQFAPQQHQLAGYDAGQACLDNRPTQTREDFLAEFGAPPEPQVAPTVVPQREFPLVPGPIQTATTNNGGSNYLEVPSTGPAAGFNGGVFPPLSALHNATPVASTGIALPLPSFAPAIAVQNGGFEQALAAPAPATIFQNGGFEQQQALPVQATIVPNGGLEHQPAPPAPVIVVTDDNQSTAAPSPAAPGCSDPCHSLRVASKQGIPLCNTCGQKAWVCTNAVHNRAGAGKGRPPKCKECFESGSRKQWATYGQGQYVGKKGAEPRKNSHVEGQRARRAHGASVKELEREIARLQQQQLEALAAVQRQEELQHQDQPAVQMQVDAPQGFKPAEQWMPLVPAVMLS